MVGTCHRDPGPICPPVAVTSLSSYRVLERIKHFVSVFSQLSSGHMLHVVNIGF